MIEEGIVNGALRKGPYGVEIYLDGQWRLCQSRLHHDDIQGHIMQYNDTDWPKLILPMEDKE